MTKQQAREAFFAGRGTGNRVWIGGLDPDNVGTALFEAWWKVVARDMKRAKKRTRHRRAPFSGLLVDDYYKRMLQTQGVPNPRVITSTVIDGHHRLAAAVQRATTKRKP